MSSGFVVGDGVAAAVGAGLAIAVGDGDGTVTGADVHDRRSAIAIESLRIRHSVAANQR
jgi:hypothetical protein